MNIKEIITNYKNGDSTEKLGIISNIVTIVTAIIALITGQLLTLKFVFSERTFSLIAFYSLAMGISLFVFYFYLKYLTLSFKVFENFIVKIAIFLVSSSVLLFVYVTIWAFVLEIS